MTKLARSVTFNNLENWKENCEEDCTPEALKTNTKKRVNVLAPKKLLFNNELTTCKQLCNHNQGDSQHRGFILSTFLALDTREPNNKNSSHNHKKWHIMMKILFSTKEDHGHSGSDYDNKATHHLINRCSTHCESNRHQRWANEVKSRWNSEQERIYLGFLLGLFIFTLLNERHLLFLISTLSLFLLVSLATTRN